MLSAASRLAVLGALTLGAGACSHVAKGAAPAAANASPAGATDHAAVTAASPPPPFVSVRVPPARPIAAPTLPPGLRISGVDYVTATDLALWLGCKGTWIDPLRKLTLTDKSNPADQAELSADSREALVNGVRVFLGEKVLGRDGRLYISRTDAECALAPLLRPALCGAPLPAPKIIVLDPGHGGEDPGTENRPLGLTEKVLTLDIVQRLKKLLETAGYKVVLTRSRDVALSPIKTVDLALRADFANREHADLFISIHFNAATKDTRGTEVFSFAPRTQRSTDSWGARVDDSENEAAPANHLDRWNTAFAAALHRGLLHALKTEDRGKKIGHLAVLRTLNCPGALVEPAIISNEAEARRVAVPAFRQQIAEALAAGVRDYAATLDSLRPKPSAAPAVTPNTTTTAK